MKQIFIDVPIDSAGLQRLKRIPDMQVTIADPITADKAISRPAEQIRKAQLCFCAYLPTNLSDLPHLELVQISSSGYSQLYGLDLPSKGVRVCNARGVFDTTIAEWNIAMMINLSRDLRQMIRNQEAHVWDRAARFQGEIRGKTVGIWGYGGIGRQTARLCKALGMEVHVLTRSGMSERANLYSVSNSGDSNGLLPDQVFCLEQRSKFLSQLDFLILSMPLTPETEGIVSIKELRALPSSAFLLNPARGPLVQESALLQALREGWIAGAAIDTHYQYPLPSEHPLWSFENVIITPHISGSDESTYYCSRIWDLFVSNVERYLLDRALLNELSPTQLLEA